MNYSEIGNFWSKLLNPLEPPKLTFYSLRSYRVARPRRSSGRVFWLALNRTTVGPNWTTVRIIDWTTIRAPFRPSITHTIGHWCFWRIKLKVSNSFTYPLYLLKRQKTQIGNLYCSKGYITSLTICIIRTQKISNDVVPLNERKFRKSEDQSLTKFVFLAA